MKTKYLIAELLKADPTGEAECVVGGEDILFVSSDPAYYDGNPQIAVRDDSNPFYNVTGFTFLNEGTKVRIHTHSLEAALLNNPDLPVFYPTDRIRKKWEDYIEAERKENRRLKQQIEQEATAERDSWFDREYIAGGRDIAVLEKKFGLTLDNTNRNQKIAVWLEECGKDDPKVLEFVASKRATWVGEPWYERKCREGESKRQKEREAAEALWERIKWLLT